MKSLSGMQLKGGWTLGRKLGEGACAEVYEVAGHDLVAKIAQLPVGKGKGKAAKEQTDRVNTLYFEYQLYNGILNGFKRACERPMHGYGEVGGYRYLILERLEKDLVAVSRDGPSCSAVGDIGLQILDGLRELHGKRYCFVDIKPDNFMMKAGKVYFIDFGLMERYVDLRSGGHRDMVQSNFNGTPSYCSIARHDGCTHSRRDDIEGLGYVLLAMRCASELPWAKAKDEASLIQSKKTCDIKKLAKDLGCPEVAEIILLARNMAYDAEPDYVSLNAILERLKKSKLGPSSVSGGGASKAGALTQPKTTSARPAGSPKQVKKRVAAAVAAIEIDDDNDDNKGVFQLRRSVTKHIDDTAPIEEVETGPFTRKRRSNSVGGAGGIAVHSGFTLFFKCISGPYNKKKFSLDFESRGTFLIGKSEDAEVSLPRDDYVSERNALLRPGSMSEAIEIKDAGSTNGTKVDGQKISSKGWTQILVGSVVTIGKTSLQLVAE